MNKNRNEPPSTRMIAIVDKAHEGKDARVFQKSTQLSVIERTRHEVIKIKPSSILIACFAKKLDRPESDMEAALEL